MIIGIDTGGTFTDFIAWDGQRLKLHKELSTPAAPDQAILRGLAALGFAGLPARIVHGSTVATNALLEGKGARTAFVTNRGFADMLSIGRQARPELYDLVPERVAPPVPPELCFETGGRIGPDGAVIEPLTEMDLKALRTAVEQAAPEAVAICLLFAFVDPRHEQAIEAALAGLAFVTCSSEVLPEYREYERGIATWLNAYVGPLIHRYLGVLEARLAPAHLAVMQSSGVTCESSFAARHAVNLLVSGPAGGLAGALHIGRCIGRERLLTFDMGGTSTDVALLDGGIQMSSEGMLGRLPVGVPMVDLHTIGAGGGSIARVDAGGLLHVGPESAGADPGPACYGAGGLLPTVTDANLVLGRLPPDVRLGGRMALDREAAALALRSLVDALGAASVEVVAQGIVDLANEHMAAALRVISVERGIDPRPYTLVSFGGAGGLHVCALARALGLREALVPAHAGVLSALGMLVAVPGRRLSRTVRQALSALDPATVEAEVARIAAPGIEALVAEGHSREAIRQQTTADLCYLGQSYPINLAWAPQDTLEARFETEHRRRYGHVLDRPLQLVTLRVALDVATPAPDFTAAARASAPFVALPNAGSTPCYRRSTLPDGFELDGPAIVIDDTQTAFIDLGWRATLDHAGNLLLAVI